MTAGNEFIDLMDQGSFLGLRALGHQPCFHATWTYERPVDLAALRQFNENLQGTLLGRLVERSPLPGGRHRWVAVDGAPEIELEAAPRPRAEIAAWTDEFADRGTDPELGPGWRIGMLTLTDGGSAVTMIVPHTLGDGLCVLEAIADAVEGHRRRPNYPRRGVRRRGRVLWQDLLEFLGSLPAVLRAVVAGVRVARKESAANAPGSSESPRAKRTPQSTQPASSTEPMRVPSACVRVDQRAWDEAAAQRGGTSNTLVSAVAARLGEDLGRTGPDGSVTLAVPVSVRVKGDTRANALGAATIRVDPAGLADDLSRLRSETKQALSAAAEQSRDLMAVLALVPLTPPSIARRAETMAMGSSALPVGCSNYGDLPDAVGRIDGDDPNDFWVRLNEPGLVPSDLDRIGGQLYVLSGRTRDSVFLSVIARPVGGGLTSEDLLGQVTATLSEFGLTAHHRD